jgi:glutaryl-CoA dehydrogenase
VLAAAPSSTGSPPWKLEAGDSGLRTFVSVQGSLAMSAIHKFGSVEARHFRGQ